MKKSAPSTRRARALRRRMTEAERHLWRHLRNRQIYGAKFRRQFPIGQYVADFACWELRLVIELDGGQHADNPADALRTHDLERMGFVVMRFWNNDVLTKTEGVLELIHNAVRARSNPSPGHAGA